MKKTKPTTSKNIWQKIASWLDQHLLFALSTLLIAFIPLYPKIPLFDIIPGYIVRVRFEDVLVLTTGLVWLIQVLRKKITWESPLSKWIAIYASIGFFSMLSAIFLIQTVPLELIHVGKTGLHLFRYLEYFSLFLMVFASIKTQRKAQIMVWAIAFTVIGAAVYGAGQKYFYWPVYSTMNREFSKGMRLYLTEHARVQSTFGGHYDLGAYLVVTLPLVLALAYQTAKKWPKKLLHLAHLAGLWLLIMSASRAPFISYGVGAGIVISLVSWQEATWLKKLISFLKKSISLGIVTGALMLFFGQDMYERFLHVLEGYPQVAAVYHEANAQRKKARDRVLDYLGVIELGPPEDSIGFDNSGLEPVLTPTDQLPVSTRPSDVYKDIPDIVEVETEDEFGNVTVTRVEQERTWSENALKYGLSMGIRLDTLWPNALRGFMRNPVLGSGYATLNKEGAYHFTEAESTDNNYLRVLGETGALGFLSFFGMIGSVIYLSAKQLTKKEVLTRALAIGLIAASIGLLVNALYIDVFAASKVAFSYWAVVGLGLATYQLKTAAKKAPAKKKTRSKKK